MQEKKETIKILTSDLESSSSQSKTPPNTPVKNSAEQPKTHGPILITPEQMSLYMKKSDQTFFTPSLTSIDELDLSDSENKEQASLS
ncbi:hypothetical protein [Legionella sp. km772]|uniref:hypothetical protein n=1 Tax=Legionella sp. km772 TaxID=2498111 RepID=UPI000F8ED73D|nr:hypothetical protein [Legionella sp. km772]RUR12760.1 hypothetical protein ELY15_04225 [Legionella sp. km772]